MNRETSIRELSETVSAILGEPLALDCFPEENPFGNIEERIRTLAPGLLAMLLTESQRDKRGCGKELRGEAEIDASGMVTLPLPDDFFLLGSVKMSDWTRPVVELTPPDAPCAEWIGSSIKGVGGSAKRPVAFLDTDTDHGKSLRLFSSGENATLERGYYIPYPAVSSSDTLDVPLGLLYPLAERIAAILAGNEGG